MPHRPCRLSVVRAATLVGCLALSGCQQVRLMYDNLTGNTPGNSARLMEDPDSPDNRRAGMARLASFQFAQKEPYTTRYKQIAASDTDPLVRAMAVRSLNVADDATATDVYVKALTDESPLVRLEGAKALAQMPTDGAAEPLLGLLNKPDENKDVRIAAAGALKHYRRTDVARALAATLSSKDFGLAWQAHRSLRKLTGQDFRFDEAAWLQYITGPAKPFG